GTISATKDGSARRRHIALPPLCLAKQVEEALASIRLCAQLAHVLHALGKTEDHGALAQAGRDRRGRLLAGPVRVEDKHHGPHPLEQAERAGRGLSTKERDRW